MRCEWNFSFFFFLRRERKTWRGREKSGRGGYYFFGCENFLIIIDEKSRSSCFWDLINAEIWRKIRKKIFCNFIRVIYFFFFFGNEEWIGNNFKSLGKLYGWKDNWKVWELSIIKRRFTGFSVRYGLDKFMEEVGNGVEECGDKWKSISSKIGVRGFRGRSSWVSFDIN